jgi:hypothetical protein
MGVVRVVASSVALLWVVHVAALSTVVRTLQWSNLSQLAPGVLMNVATRVAAAERTLVVNRGLGQTVSRWQTLETLFISNFYALLSPGPSLSGAMSVNCDKNFDTSVTGGVSSLPASRGVEFVVIIVWGFVCAGLDPTVSMTLLRLPFWLGAVSGRGGLHHCGIVDRAQRVRGIWF